MPRQAHNAIIHQLPRFSRLVYARSPGRVLPYTPTNELIWRLNGVSCTHISKAHGQCTLCTCFREGRTSTSCRLERWPKVHDHPHGTVFLQAKAFWSETPRDIHPDSALHQWSLNWHCTPIQTVLWSLAAPTLERKLIATSTNQKPTVIPPPTKTLTYLTKGY